VTTSATAITFTGRLYGEAELLAVANAYQQATGHHKRRPPMDKVTAENAAAVTNGSGKNALWYGTCPPSRPRR